MSIQCLHNTFVNAAPNQGSRVLILTGEFIGEEGICLGPKSADGRRWAVSPDSSHAILELTIEQEFGLLL